MGQEPEIRRSATLLLTDGGNTLERICRIAEFSSHLTTRPHPSTQRRARRNTTSKRVKDLARACKTKYEEDQKNGYLRKYANRKNGIHSMCVAMLHAREDGCVCVHC